MRPTTRALTAALALIALVTTAVLASFVADAQAQSPVVGTADFRNAPQLVPGTYSDRIVTGDSAWYSIVYSNGTPYEFQVEVQGSAPSELSLTATLVAPTLTPIDGPAAVVRGNGVVYPSGQTNLWFLRVSLTTTDQPGLEYPITISVDGVESAGLDSCSDVPGCSLDDEYAALATEIAQAEAAVDAAGIQETRAAVEAQVQNLRGFEESTTLFLPGAEERLAQNQATMSTLCAPDPTCETFPSQGSQAPLLGLAVGGLALLFGAFKAVGKLRGEPEEGDPEEAKPASKQSSLERARREGAANRKAAKKAEKGR